MSNIVPPLLSNSPPPMLGAIDEEEDDEFGDFAVATELSYGCDALSLPSSPRKSPKQDTNESISEHCHDVVASSSQIPDVNTSKNIGKDFQDRRKVTVPYSCDNESVTSVSDNQEKDAVVDTFQYNSSKIKIHTENKYNSFQYFPEIPPDIVEEDEYVDVDGHFVEEFEDFQDFESSKNDIDVNVKTVNEFEVDKVSAITSSRRDHETSSELAKQTPCDVVENVSIETKNKNEEPKSENLSDTNEIQATTSNVFGMRDAKNNAVSDESERLTSEEKLCNNSKSIDSTNSGEVSNIKEEYSPKVLCQSKSSFLNDVPCEDPSTKDSDDSFKDVMSSESDNIDIKDEPIAGENIAEEISSENEFGSFENHSFEPNSQSKPIDEPQPTTSDDMNKDDDDEFGDFETPVTDLKLHLEEDPFNETKVANTKNNFGNFDDHVFEGTVQGDFGDFSKFPSSTEVQVDSKTKSKTLNGEDEEFGDFNDYSLQTQTSQNESEPEAGEASQFQNTIDIESIPQKAEAVILEMFPPMDQTTEAYQSQDFIKDNTLFHELKDITDTSALLYQWSKSNCQHFLLQALNIDARNILYGPRWNESMPRYAATLGFTPLEPVKSEILTPTAAESSTSTLPSQTPSSDSAPQTDIPSAQFDWVGSGLTNPLEMTPKKIIQKQESQHKDLKNIESSIAINTSILIKTPEIDSKPSNFEFASFTQPNVSTNLQIHQDSESVKSLQLHDELPPEETANKGEDHNSTFDDFTSFQSSSKIEENVSRWSHNNTVPLRETHISNCNGHDAVSMKIEKIGANFDEPGWLKPTILTPDLPRKESIVTEEVHEEEEEFADFQASQPVPNNKTTPEQTTMETMQPENKSDTNVAVTSAVNELDDDDDDEFTDFQSTLPNSHSIAKPISVPAQPLQPSLATLEPLKSSVLLPTISSDAPTLINWPDPGITDDDLKRFELNYKPNAGNSDGEEHTQTKSKETVSASDKSSETLDSRKSENSQELNKTEDDDDWSDFVSNQGSSEPPVIHGSQNFYNKTTNHLKQPSRTSTPELQQLSVPQLNQIQPPKKPVPIITQQGLVQTKLSSHLPISIEPLVHPSVQQTSTYPQTNQLQNGFQPSLISNQFAAQFGQSLIYQNTNANIHHNIQKQDTPKQAKQVPQPEIYGNTKLHQYFSHPQPSKPPIALVSSSRPEELDEEWTDFVSNQSVSSSQSPAMISNGLPRSAIPKPNFDWNRPPQFTSWTANITPNIITNPVSFDTFQGFSSPTHSDLLKSKTNNRKNPSMVVQPKKSTVPSISTVPDLEFIAPKNRTWKK